MPINQKTKAKSFVFESRKAEGHFLVNISIRCKRKIFQICKHVLTATINNEGNKFM